MTMGCYCLIYSGVVLADSPSVEFRSSWLQKRLPPLLHLSHWYRCLFCLKVGSAPFQTGPEHDCCLYFSPDFGPGRICLAESLDAAMRWCSSLLWPCTGKKLS